MKKTALVAAALSVVPFLGTAAQAADGVCTLTVPAQPLTAAGLATPYELANCDETNPDQSAFVEAAVLDPATGALSLYHPLVVNAGTAPAAAPVVPTLPDGAVVGIWFGSNADAVALTGPGAAGAVTGLGHGDTFGQFSYLHAAEFFAAANAAIADGKMVVPDLGVGADGLPCPTVRDFAVVDQDQSDNLATAYWVTADGQMSQVPADGAVKLTNGSDEGLLAKFIDPALGCTPWKLPSLDGLPNLPSLAANELQAAAKQAAPVALVPLNDPMTLRAGKPSVGKTNAYRRGVDQPPVNPHRETPAAYCAHLTAVAPARFATDAALFAAAPGPGGSVLGEFLAARYAAALPLLGCPATGRSHGHRHRVFPA